MQSQLHNDLLTLKMFKRVNKLLHGNREINSKFKCFTCT